MRMRFMTVVCGVVVIMAAMLTACAGDNEKGPSDARTAEARTVVQNKQSDELQVQAVNRGMIAADSDSDGESEGDVSNAAAQGNVPAEKEDDTVRALLELPSGQLSVKPASKAYVQPLGAPSCYGVETDLSWSGDYEAVWEPTGGEAASVLSFPEDFTIVQPNDKPVTMQHLKTGGTDLFVYMPRYTDCHALETYVFGVQDGKAFSVPFIIGADENQPFIGQLPQHLLHMKGEDLVVTGGYSAGDDTIAVYHFRYDGAQHALVLTKTEQMQANEILN